MISCEKHFHLRARVQSRISNLDGPRGYYNALNANHSLLLAASFTTLLSTTLRARTVIFFDALTSPAFCDNNTEVAYVDDSPAKQETRQEIFATILSS